MSISRQIRKNIQRNKDTCLSEARIFYPKGFKAYAILLSILSGFIVVDGIVVIAIALSIEKNRQMDKCLVLMLFILIIYMVPLYEIILVLKLYTKKISLQVNKGEIIFNGVLRCRKMKITDIEIIKMAAGRRINCILIKAKKSSDIFSDSKMIIPVVWFGKENLREFIEVIKIQRCRSKISLNYIGIS